jgi:hypothetical protein
MTCTSGSDPSSPTEEDKARRGEEEKDVDEREVAVRNNIYQLCRANEVCHTFSDCVCDDNCGKGDAGKSGKSSVSSSSSSMKAWLARPASNDNLRQPPVFEYFSMVGGANTKEWLAKSGAASTSPEVDSTLYPPFVAQGPNSAWLLPQRSRSFQQEGCPFTRLRNSQSCEWISSGVEKPVFSSDEGTEQWLAASARSSLPEKKTNPWLLSEPSLATPPTTDGATVEKLKAYIEQAQPKYQWSLTASPQKEPQQDKPIPKKQELPECEFKDSNRYEDSAKWLLVSKDESKEEKNAFKTKEVAMEQDNMPDLFPLFAKTKEALGEWLMNAHSDF